MVDLNPIASTLTLTPISEGRVEVSVSASDTYHEVTGIFDLTIAQVLSTDTLSTHASIYPNPTSGIVNIPVEEIGVIHLTDVAGKKIPTAISKSGSIHFLDLHHLTDGVYYLIVIYPDETKQEVKIVLQKGLRTIPE